MKLGFECEDLGEWKRVRVTWELVRTVRSAATKYHCIF